MKRLLTASTVRAAALLGASLLVLSACHYHHPYGGYYGYGYGYGHRGHHGYKHHGRGYGPRGYHRRDRGHHGY